jgi:hypothetical protein
MSHDPDAPLCIPTHLWLILSILFFSTVALASAQPYHYETIDVPFAGVGVTHITGITDLGTMSGTYLDT